jgi:DNA-binding transcriptional regulator YiaG
MKQVTCPECHNGVIEQIVIPQHRTQLGGADLIVKDAVVARCNSCGFTAVAATELKRWEEQRRSAIQERGFLPTPERIEKVLAHFGLTRADLAHLLGVTRQTIHGWMKDPALIPEGPGPMVIQLLEAEAEGRVRGVYEKLVADARSRGYTLSQGAKSKSRGVNPDLRRVVPTDAKFWELKTAPERQHQLCL